MDRGIKDSVLGVWEARERGNEGSVCVCGGGGS